MRSLGALAPALAAVLLAGCSLGRQAVAVGAKIGTEQAILGEIMAQHLERRLGEPVNRRFGLGDTEMLHHSMLRGEVDLYAEYSGTALRNILRFSMSNDPEAVYERVRTVYRSNYRIDWLPPLGFDSRFGVAVKTAVAKSQGLLTLSQAEQRPVGWRLGYAGDFATRPDGMPQLTAGYRLPFRSAPVLMEQGQLYSAPVSGAADMIPVHVTDGPLASDALAVLEDDKRVFPPYQACILLRERAETAHPELRNVLTELSGTISDTEMRRMNAEVDVSGRRPADVARDFLKRAQRGGAQAPGKQSR